LDAVRGVGSVELAVSGLGGFPDLGRPKVLWAGVQGDLGPVFEAIRDTTDGFGQKADTEFHPHVTLARINPGSKAVGYLARGIAADIGEIARWTAAEVTLMESRPDGSYAPLYQVAL